MNKLIATVGALLACLFLGFGIGSGQVAPSYALAYLDDEEKTYLALPCLTEWQMRPSARTNQIRQATVGDGSKAGYKADEACRESGGFIADGRSLSGILFEKLGVLPPLTPWWDRPYRTEEGKLVVPSKILKR